MGFTSQITYNTGSLRLFYPLLGGCAYYIRKLRQVNSNSAQKLPLFSTQGVAFPGCFNYNMIYRMEVFVAFAKQEGFDLK